MVEFLISVFCAILWGYLAHELAIWGNRQFRELNFSPNICGILGVIFGLPGLACLALFGAIKVMVKRMIKH